MAEEPKSIPRPAPRSTTHWKLPSVLRIEGDGHDPRKTRILDDATGKEVKLRIHALQFNVNVDQPNSVELVLGDVAIRAKVHHVQYTIDEEDLAVLAMQNGFEIVAVPSYPARVSHYGPAELQVTFRHFPDLTYKHRNLIAREAIEGAEKMLRIHLDAMKAAVQPVPEADEPLEGEILIWAHRHA